MKKYTISFSREFEVVVAVPDDATEADVERAAKRAARFEIDDSWDVGDWDVRLYELDNRPLNAKVKPELALEDGRFRELSECSWWRSKEGE